VELPGAFRKSDSCAFTTGGTFEGAATSSTAVSMAESAAASPHLGLSKDE